MALWEEPPTAEPWDGPAVPDEPWQSVEIDGKLVDVYLDDQPVPEPNGEED